MLTAGFCCTNNSQYLLQGEHSCVSHQKHPHDFRNSIGDGPSFIKHHSLDLQEKTPLLPKPCKCRDACMFMAHRYSQDFIKQLTASTQRQNKSTEAGILVGTLNYLYSRSPYTLLFIPHKATRFTCAHIRIPDNCNCRTEMHTKDMHAFTGRIYVMAP